MRYLRTVFALFALPFVLLSCATGPAGVADTSSATSQLPAAEAPAALSESPAAGRVLGEPLPVDPAVTTGQLPNGLRYYIRENDEPRNRAFLRLALNAGSILEDEDQLGLAHFTEHMAFNGTEKYSGNQIIAFLERLGMQFGPDVNAYTGFDQTVYELTVPTDDPQTFEQAFEVLLEWADRMTLRTEDIDKERGVIIEEWRSRRGAAQRVAEEQYPVLFADSRYAARLPIGDVDLIASFPPEALRRFYDDWYRPDLTAVVAVGDFDAEAVEAMIVGMFSGFEGPAAPRERTLYSVPGHEDTRFVVTSDPETAYTDVTIVSKRTSDELSTEADYRRMIVGSLFTSMMNARLDEISRRSDAPFIGAGVSSGQLVRTTAAATLAAAVEGNDVAPALEALLIEARRVVEHGFTPTELERARQDRMRAVEQAYRERENTNSASLADEYVRAYLEGEAIPGIAIERELHEALLPGITLEEVNQLAADYLSEENRVVLASTIESESLPDVTVEELEETFRLARGVPVDPYEDRVVQSDLLGPLPAPGRLVSEEPLDAEGIVRWELSNGVRVVWMSTDFRADQVVFTAFSPGGTSLAPDADYRSAQYATTFVQQMGYGELSPPDLERLLAGKAVSATPYIGSIDEGISGASSAEDLELLFQLIHLKLTAPRRDEDAFAALKRQFAVVVANQSAQPQYQFSRLIAERFNLAHPRAMPVDAAGVDSIALDAVLDTYRDRFADFSDFTFVFVGNLQEESFRPLVEQYLGTLPSSGRNESWRDVGIERPAGIVVDSVRSGIDPVSQVAVFLHGDYEFSQANNLDIRTVERALEIRMQEVIREEESGTYGVGVQAEFARVPRERFTMVITFRADPGRVDQLTERLFDVVDELRATTLDESYVQRIRETLRSGFQEGLTSNQFWLGQIEYALENGRAMSDIRRYLDLVDAVTAQTVRQSAARYLDVASYVQVTLYPEE